MKSFTLVFTIATLALACSVDAQQHGLRQSHRSLAHRHQRAEVQPLREREDTVQPQGRRLQRRTSCQRNGSGTNTTTPSSALSSVVVASPTPASSAAATTGPPVKVDTTSTSTPPATTSSTPQSATNGHQFTLTNKCSSSIQPVIADTMCGYSPRCAGAASYSGPQPGSLDPGSSQTVTINDDWVGRIFAQNGKCGSKGESCTITEFNLDSGSQYTPQAYDISNIQGFTQSISVGASGCETSTCTNANCGCTNAYAVGDMSGCGADLPVKACGAGNISFDIVFCP